MRNLHTQKIMKSLLKNFTESIKITAIALVLTLGATYAYAAWTGPTSAPPNGNTPAPVNVGTTNQIKNGGLGVNSLAVYGDSVVTGNSSVDGYLKVGVTTATCNGNLSGALRYNTTSLTIETCNGSSWKALVSTTPIFTTCTYQGSTYQIGEVVTLSPTCNVSSAVDCVASRPVCIYDGVDIFWTVPGSKSAQQCLGNGSWLPISLPCTKSCSYTCPNSK